MGRAGPCPENNVYARSIHLHQIILMWRSFNGIVLANTFGAVADQID